MRMCDLAVALQLSPSGLTRRLDGLVRNGFVERIGSDDDRRVMLAVLTEQRLRGARGGGADPRRQCAPAHPRPPRARSDPGDGRRLRGDPRRARRPAVLSASSVTTTLPAGFSCYVANVGDQGRHRRLRRRRRRHDVRRRRRVHQEPLRGTERGRQPRTLTDGRARAVVVVSKNANVATGSGRARRRPRGGRAASPTASAVTPADVVVASTGVIGRHYPMDRVRAGIAAIPDDAPVTRRRRRGPRDHDHRHRHQDRRGRRSARAAPGSSASPRASA